MTQSTTTILHARIPAALGAWPARVALQQLAAAMEPQRHGLPAQAIVVVRRLQCPVAMLSRSPAGEPLTVALRAAVRPAAQDFVGAGVGTVWFADEAELLACLARDVLGTTQATRWWWPLLLGGTPTLMTAAQRWCRSARAVPWALAQLDASVSAPGWLRALQPEGRAALLLAVRQAYPIGSAALAWLDGIERAADPLQPGHGGHPPAEAGDAAPLAAAADRPCTTPAQAWQRLCETLRTAPQRLLGDDAPRWLQAGTEAGVPPIALRGAVPPAPRSPGSVAPNVPATGHVRLDDERLARDQCNAAAEALAAPVARRAARPPRSPLASGSTAAPAFVAPGAAPAAATPMAAGSAPLANAPSPLARSGALPMPGPRSHTEFDTAFGGLFFLLNVALDAGLYGDFTQSLHPGLPVSPWRFLQASGRRFFGRRFAADPLAAWLMERAGGADPLPAAPPTWQAPAAWLRPFDSDCRPWRWLHAPNGQRLCHPAGFIAAQALGGAPWAAVPAQVQHVQTLQPISLRQGLLGLLWPWLGCRIARAVGLPDAASALRLMAQLPARVQAHGDRLDLRLRLSSLPLALRLAGLDRDPGWLPAAGCDLRFHFD